VSTPSPLASRVRAGLALAAILTMLAGCSSSQWGFPYRAGVQQGNWLTKEQVAVLRPGMTPEQVRFALGTPALQSVLHADRWDYPYYYRNGNGNVELRTLTVFFDKDKRLVRWQGDEQPELQPFQIAKENVGIVKAEEAQLKLDAVRAGNDANLPTSAEIMPGVTLQQGMGESISDPSALPGAPDDAPAALD
jgi:outer membrane protein assembly factor BamE